MDSRSARSSRRSGDTSAAQGRLARLAVASAAALLVSVGAVPAMASATSLPTECAESSGVVTCTYAAGDNLFTVPAGVTTIHVLAVGGEGGWAYDPNAVRGSGGLGAQVSGDLVVVPGATLHARVATDGQAGSSGSPGGGPGGETVGLHNCQAGGGGGASDVRTDTTLDSRVIVAAGGGGAGCAGWDATGGPLSNDGGGAGLAGWPSPSRANLLSGTGGQAGCLPPDTACGHGGIGAVPVQFDPASTGGSGQMLAGGSGATGNYGGGGGGAGWYGGGGGGGGTPSIFEGSPYGPGGGGGGGSSLVPAGGASRPATSAPQVVISYVVPSPSTFNVAGAASAGATSMTVTYDAAPDAGQATTLANYAVPGLTLSGTPVLSSNTVTITTSVQAAQTFTVTASNVTRATDATALTGNSATFTGTAPVAPPQAGVSPASLAFGSILVGTVTASQQVAVTNTASIGAGSLHIDLVATTGTNAADFRIESDPCSNATLAPSDTCTVLVAFTPTARGVRSAILRIRDDAAGSPRDVSMSGTGAAPIAQVAPTSIDFGTVSVGTTSGHRTVTITNIGDTGQNLLLSAETITGPNASEFAFAGDTCITNFIAAGASCTIDLTFTPSGAGVRAATLTISDNGIGSPHTVALVGTGATPSADLAVSISSSPNPVKRGQRVTYTITILNAGPSTAFGILINDSLSSQSTFVSATIAGGTCVTPVKGASGVVSCSLASLASGSNGSIQIVVTVIAKKNSITNTVTVSAGTADPNLANNTASITTRVK